MKEGFVLSNWRPHLKLGVAYEKKHTHIGLTSYLGPKMGLPPLTLGTIIYDVHTEGEGV